MPPRSAHLSARAGCHWRQNSMLDSRRARLGRRRRPSSLDCLALEQNRASPDAVTTRLGADRAVAMVLGVPIALLGTRGARTHTGDEQIADGEEIPLSGSRKNPRGGVADVGADQIERDAGSQRDDVLLDEIGVRARRAGLDAGQAGVDCRGQTPPPRPERPSGRHPAFGGSQVHAL